MRNSWQTTSPGAGYKVYIYTSDTRQMAKVYLSANATEPVSTMPQITTDETGLIKFWVDTNDYDLDQRFDIEVYDSLDNFWSKKRLTNIFNIKENLGLGYALLYDYTWNNNIIIHNGECMQIVLPPNKEITIPDGYSLNIEDGGDLILFSL